MQKKYHLTHANVGLIAILYSTIPFSIAVLSFIHSPDKVDVLPQFLGKTLSIFFPYFVLKIIWFFKIYICFFIKIGEKL